MAPTRACLIIDELKPLWWSRWLRKLLKNVATLIVRILCRRYMD